MGLPQFQLRVFGRTIENNCTDINGIGNGRIVWGGMYSEFIKLRFRILVLPLLIGSCVPCIYLLFAIWGLGQFESDFGFFRPTYILKIYSIHFADDLFFRKYCEAFAYGFWFLCAFFVAYFICPVIGWKQTNENGAKIIIGFSIVLLAILAFSTVLMCVMHFNMNAI
jgi:hypothetical protein